MLFASCFPKAIKNSHDDDDDEATIERKDQSGSLLPTKGKKMNKLNEEQKKVEGCEADEMTASVSSSTTTESSSIETPATVSSAPISAIEINKTTAVVAATNHKKEKVSSKSEKKVEEEEAKTVAVASEEKKVKEQENIVAVEEKKEAASNVNHINIASFFVGYSALFAILVKMMGSKLFTIFSIIIGRGSNHTSISITVLELLGLFVLLNISFTVMDTHSLSLKVKSSNGEEGKGTH